MIGSLLKEGPLPVRSSNAAAIINAETDALERLDIPFFQASGRDLISDRLCLEPEFFASSGYAEAKKRLGDLAREDLAQTRTALRLLWIMSL